jgi:hypothetical protein
MRQRLCALAFSAMLTVASLFGQASDGNITGTVLDASGAAIPNASVQLENTETGVKSTTKTDASGGYRFGNVLIGRHSITVSANGFTTSNIRDLIVELNKTATANVILQVGTVSTAVDVSEAASTIDTTTSQLSNNYAGRLAVELPTSANPTGGVLNLALLGAGVSSSGGIGVGTGPSVGGQRPRNNNFTIEGVDNNRKDVTGPTLNVPNNSVAEFTVLQNQFSAEFGHSSGGQFNTVLRGGTNSMQASIYVHVESQAECAGSVFQAPGNPDQTAL